MKNRFLLVVISILIAIVLGFGGIFLVALGIRSARAIVTSHNITIDLGTVNYLASYYKMLYIEELLKTGISASDSEEFWNSTAKDGRSYGEHFEENFRIYLNSLVANADIYSSYHGYTAEDKINVAATSDQILAYYAEGSVSVFNSMAEKYGFDFNDFQNASALLFKASRAKDYIYGEGGMEIASETELCDKFFEQYTRVSMIFISNGKLISTDNEGNCLYDGEGNLIYRDMTEEEKKERNTLISKLLVAMNDGLLDAEMIEEHLQYSDVEPDMVGKDHYFHPDLGGNGHFAGHFSEVVSLTSGMKEGEIVMLTTSDGVFFIHKKPIEDRAYMNNENNCLTDFYAAAAEYYYAQVFAELWPTVIFDDRFARLSLVEIPVINDFYVREYKDLWQKRIIE